MKKKSILFYILNFANFFITPLFMRNTGYAMILLLVVMPLFCFIVSLFYCKKIRFNFIYPVITALIFIPTIFIYYNSSAWIYALLFGGISLLGEFAGLLFKK